MLVRNCVELNPQVFLCIMRKISKVCIKIKIIDTRKFKLLHLEYREQFAHVIKCTPINIYIHLY